MCNLYILVRTVKSECDQSFVKRCPKSIDIMCIRE